MWGLVADWEGTYGAWKHGLFKDLKVRGGRVANRRACVQRRRSRATRCTRRTPHAHAQVDAMADAAARFNKQVAKLGRDVKAWPVWGWLQGVVESFKKTMPLITDLRNPAMRPRHWQELMEHVGAR
jgi:dynein heavy chain